MTYFVSSGTKKTAQPNSESCGWLSVKFLDWVDYRPEESLLNFGGDPEHILDILS